MTTRRAILEVLKFTNAIDVLAHTSLVSQMYAALSDTDELWHQLLADTFPAPNSVLTPPKCVYQSLSQVFLPVLHPQSLHKFSVLTNSWTSVRLSTEIAVNRSMSIVIVPDQRLFLTGASTLDFDTFLIDHRSGDVSPLQTLLHHRGSMGVIVCDSLVYAFCGFDITYKRYSEVYSIAEKRWKALPDALYSRSGFNPCSRQGKVYLLGGCGTVQSEYFHIASEAYYTLPLQTPNKFCTVGFCTDTELFAVTKSGYYRTVDEEEWELVQFGFDFDKSFWSNFSIVDVFGVIYVLQTSAQRIVALSLSDKRFQKYPLIPLPYS